MFGGFELAVAVCCDCGVLGLWLWGLCSVVILFGGWGKQSSWCHFIVGGTVLAIAVSVIAW